MSDYNKPLKLQDIEDLIIDEYYIDKDYPELDKLIEDMHETMYATSGVGLAAPQVNKSIRLFIVDATPFNEDNDELPEAIDFKQVFINAKIVEESGEEWSFTEGCLSVPGISEEVSRPPKIRIQYYDRNWEYHDEEYEGIPARVIQHEYDHLDGKLFVDKISPLRRKLLSPRLNAISRGRADSDYKIIYPKK